MANESDSAKLSRLRTELIQARSTRDRLELHGQSAGFGGVSFSGVQYEAILQRIARLEAQVDALESRADSSSIRPGVNRINFINDDSGA